MTITDQKSAASWLYSWREQSEERRKIHYGIAMEGLFVSFALSKDPQPEQAKGFAEGIVTIGEAYESLTGVRQWRHEKAAEFLEGDNV